MSRSLTINLYPSDHIQAIPPNQAEWRFKNKCLLLHTLLLSCNRCSLLFLLKKKKKKDRSSLITLDHTRDKYLICLYTAISGRIYNTSWWVFVVNGWNLKIFDCHKIDNKFNKQISHNKISLETHKTDGVMTYLCCFSAWYKGTKLIASLIREFMLVLDVRRTPSVLSF